MVEHICTECGDVFTGRKKKYCSKDCSDDVRRRSNRKRMRKINPPKPDVIIICEWCDKEHEVPARTAHQARFCNDDCRDKWWSRVVYEHKPIEEHNAERRKQRIARQKRLERECAIKAFNRSIQTVIKFKEEEQRIIDLTRDCDECGEEFYNPSPMHLTCSTTCSRKRGNRISRINRGSRYNESNLIDRDITLTKLYERDEGICHICNQPCDYDDMTITDEGYYIVSKTYPSVDHLYPIARGGKHSWNNVNLAHHYCNTIKRDKMIENRHEKALV